MLYCARILNNYYIYKCIYFEPFVVVCYFVKYINYASKFYYLTNKNAKSSRVYFNFRKKKWN